MSRVVLKSSLLESILLLVIQHKEVRCRDNLKNNLKSNKLLCPAVQLHLPARS